MRGLQAARSLGRDANPSERFGVINVPKKSNFEKKKSNFFLWRGGAGGKAPLGKNFFWGIEGIYCLQKQDL